MTTQEIHQLGNKLAVRRLKSLLWKRLRIERPTLARDTIMRAFKMPDTNSVLFDWIYNEAVKILEEDNARIQRAKEEATA